MRLVPQAGYVHCKTHEIKQERKGLLIMPDERKEVYMEVIAGGDFDAGTLLITNPYKSKIQVKDDEYLIDVDDVVAYIEA
jgi:hypothetical protein